MRKRTKAAIAIGGATVLLTGGLGTTAWWVDSVASSSAEVTTGQLAISDGDASDWIDVSVDEPTLFDPSTQYLVPGDKIRSTTEFTVDADGKNLRATLSFTEATGLPSGVSVAPVTITLDRDGAGSGAPVGFDPATDTIQAGEGQTLAVTFEIAFARATTGSQNQPVDVSHVRAIVAQARPS